MFLRQAGLCACGCGQKLGARTVAEHSVPVAMGNEAKPDCILNVECAAWKTKQDVKDIWRARRRAGEAGQDKRRKARKAAGKRSLLPTKKMESGGKFPTKLTKGFDGKIRERKVKGGAK